LTKQVLRLLLCAGVLTTLATLQASAQVSGAIFTTRADGTEVNYNIYSDKNDVYLNGGPGLNAPSTAAGLPDGVYVFQVTDPSGKTLLSQDAIGCREFNVANGNITLGVPGPCPHKQTTTLANGGYPVQLMPYADTPNQGNEYKAWAELLTNYQKACGTSLNQIDCSARGTKHGFTPSLSKTDNFKVGSLPLEIDTRFFGDTNGDGSMDYDESFIDGLEITWHDTLGASNNKYSLLDLALDINHEAHVEAVEVGTHIIDVYNQPGCTVGAVYLNGQRLQNAGPQSVAVQVKSSMKSGTLRVDVACR
jgi:hypothetical protein